MQEKFKDFQILHGREEKVNPNLTAYQVELAQVEAEIEKLLDKQTEVAPLVRTGGSRHTGLAALPHRNIHHLSLNAHKTKILIKPVFMRLFNDTEISLMHHR